MKVLLLNGSPRGQKCTYTALKEIEKVLNENDVQTEIVNIGAKPISGCIGCQACMQTGKCFIDDGVNEFVEKAKNADGFIIGSPVHYAAATGAVTSFLDRAFYGKGKAYAGKPGAAIVSCRRGGASAAFDQLNKYFTICNMPVVPSQYWNQVHGTTPEEVLQDEEGLQTMRTLARNMVWMLRCIELGKENGIEFPEHEAVVRTNFISK